jgi:hypothetical protein
MNRWEKDVRVLRSKQWAGIMALMLSPVKGGLSVGGGDRGGLGWEKGFMFKASGTLVVWGGR